MKYKPVVCVISGYHRGVAENSCLLGYYAARSSQELPLLSAINKEERSSQISSDLNPQKHNG